MSRMEEMVEPLIFDKSHGLNCYSCIVTANLRVESFSILPVSNGRNNLEVPLLGILLEKLSIKSIQNLSLHF